MIKVDDILKKLKIAKQQQLDNPFNEDILTYSTQAINKISILYLVIHQRASENSADKIINASGFDRPEVLREIYQYFCNNRELIPQGYSLTLNQGNTIHGIGASHDKDFGMRTAQIMELKNFFVPHLVSLIARIHSQMHTICQEAINSSDRNKRYNFFNSFQYSTVGLEGNVTPALTDLIYSFYKNNSEMIPVGYALRLTEDVIANKEVIRDKVIHGRGPLDPNHHKTASRLRNCTNLSQLACVNPVYPAELCKLRQLFDQYAKGDIPGINMESLEYAITQGVGQCLQSYFVTFSQTTLKSCNTYQCTVQAFLDDCYRLIMQKRDTIEYRQTPTKTFQYFHNLRDETAAIKALDTLKQEVVKLWNDSKRAGQQDKQVIQQQYHR